VTIALDGDRARYCPGDVLSGEYRIHGVQPGQIDAMELSVLWHSKGKGDEDLDVHLFQRFSAEDGDLLDPRQPGRFSTQLPNTPWSYEGVLVKIRWCVRVRIFIRGAEIMAEIPFTLGDVPPARAVLP
jgi:hypothetical protein